MKVKKKEDDDETHKCIFCGVNYNYNFERELESTRPHYMMSVWYKPNNTLTKLKKKIIKQKRSSFLDRKRDYICIACALSVNESLMRHLKNFDIQRIEFEREFN